MAEYTLHDLYLLAKLPAAKSGCVPLSLSQSAPQRKLPAITDAVTNANTNN